MTLQEIRDKIAATKNELRTLVTSAETEEQRASVTTLETRLNAEEAELASSQKWDEQQQRLQDRLSTETLTEQVPRQHTRESALEAEAEVRERGALVLTREFVGDMLNSRERPWDDEYRSRRQTEVDKDISKAMLRTDAMDASHRFSPEFQRAAADLTIGTTSGALGGFLIPPDTAAYMLLQRRMKAFHGRRARGLGSHSFQ